MKCPDCLPLLDEYYDRELDVQTTARVGEHLSVCGSCNTYYRSLEREEEVFLQYECSVEPAPDFWKNVMARAVAEKAQSPSRLSRIRDWLVNSLGNLNAPRLSPSLTALLLLATIGITIGVTRYFNSRERETASESIAQNQGATEKESVVGNREVVRPVDSPGENLPGVHQATVSEKPQLAKRNGPPSVANKRSAGRSYPKSGVAGRKQTPDNLVREAEQKYVAAIAMLSRDINRRRSRIDPETALRFERTLSAVDRTIADTRRAARKHPGDPVVAQYMLTAYSRKVDVLREIASY